jgi:hypothetical protein
LEEYVSGDELVYQAAKAPNVDFVVNNVFEDDSWSSEGRRCYAIVGSGGIIERECCVCQFGVWLKVIEFANRHAYLLQDLKASQISYVPYPQNR